VREGVADGANAKRDTKGGADQGGDRAKRPLETRTPGPQDMRGPVRRGGGVQLTESAGEAQ